MRLGRCGGRTGSDPSCDAGIKADAWPWPATARSRHASADSEPKFCSAFTASASASCRTQSAFCSCGSIEFVIRVVQIAWTPRPTE